MRRSVYVLRSDCETITKFGCSSAVQSRVESISVSERKKYHLVYYSDRMEEQEAYELERKINHRFKEDVIKGKEWLSTHPLEVIKFIISEMGVPKKVREIPMDTLAEYPVWLCDSKAYASAYHEQDNLVRIGAGHIAYVRFLYNCQFVVLGFCNIGDANKFARENKHNVKVTPIITKLLYDTNYYEWVQNRIYNTQEPLFFI